MDKTTWYQESRQLIYEQMGMAVLAVMVFGFFGLLVGLPFAFDYPWLYSCWFTLMALVLGFLLLARFWRLWSTPVFLLTGRVKQRRLVTRRPFSLYHPAREHFLLVEPLAVARLDAVGQTTPASLSGIVTDYRVPPVEYERVREGDEIQLLCVPLVKRGIRVVEHSGKSAPVAETAQPSAAPETGPAATTPPRSKSLVDLHQDYRAYRGRQLVLILAIGGGLSYMGLMMALGSLIERQWVMALCMVFWVVAGLLITAFFVWRLWQVRLMRLTAVVISRKEELRHSRGAVLWRNYYLRLRPLQAATFPLNAEGQLTAATETLPLPHNGHEFEYTGSYELFQSVQENETVELICLPRFKRIIGRLD